MRLEQWLAASQSRLEKSGIATARLDTLVLLEDCLSKDRAQLLAHTELKLTASQLKTLNTQIAQRSHHVPLSYIRHRTEFYGREFYVDERVLEPRPESETMIELLKSLPEPATVIDVGTGSGALIITAALEISGSAFVAVDIDQNCLDVAVQNAQRHDATIDFYKGDLLAALPSGATPEPTALLCNLPYVPDDFHINTAATHEPKIALFGGLDGLDLYRQLFDQTNGLVTKPSYILTESLPPQHKTLTGIALAHGYRQKVEDDFIQLFELAP